MHRRHPWLRFLVRSNMPEGGGGGGSPDPGTPQAPAETARITLPGGVVMDLPKEDAEKIIQAQQRANEERDMLARKAGAAEAERRAAEDRASAEAREKEAIRLAKDGEIAKAKEILTAEANSRSRKLEGRLVERELEAQVRRIAPHLDDASVSDITGLIVPRAAYDAENGRVQFIASDGAPVTKDGAAVDANAYLTDWLAARPHWSDRRAPPPQGGTPRTAPIAGTIRLADLATANAATIAAVTSGRIKVIE